MKVYSRQFGGFPLTSATWIQEKQVLENLLAGKFLCIYVVVTGGGNIMCVCLYQKSVCKVYRTEGVYCRYKNPGICTI